MSKFKKSNSHHFGTTQPRIERLNFDVLRNLDNRTAVAPVFRESRDNPFCNRPGEYCHKPCEAKGEPCLPPVAEEPSAEVCHHDHIEIHEMYHEDKGELTETIANPQHPPPEEVKVDVSRFLKRQATTRW